MACAWSWTPRASGCWAGPRSISSPASWARASSSTIPTCATVAPAARASRRSAAVQPAVEGREILKGLSLEVKKGEIHALMGPNGSGKSTFANTLMGHPRYEVTAGDIRFKGASVLEMEPDERSRAGLFMAFQYPVAIPGLSVANFLRTALNARLAPPETNGTGAVPARRGIAPKEFRALLQQQMARLRMDESFATRYLNDGFSGGEKKRAEILQMA